MSRNRNQLRARAPAKLGPASASRRRKGPLGVDVREPIGAELVREIALDRRVCAPAYGGFCRAPIVLAWTQTPNQPEAADPTAARRTIRAVTRQSAAWQFR